MVEPAGSKARIAVVDDEEDLRGAVAAYLRLQGMDAVECDGGAALDRAIAARGGDGGDGGGKEAGGRTRDAFDLLVLDVTMPGEDGLAIARRMRAESDVGIIMLTARAEIDDRLAGLDLGVDDYMAKPFELRELAARIRTVLRRAGPRPAAAPVRAAAPAAAYVDALWAQERGSLVRVAVEDIEWIEADRDYVLLHTPGRAHSLRATMDELERQLDPAAMLRLHRSTFVPPATIAGFRRQGRGGKVQLANGRMIAVGPAYVAAVARAMEGR